ncbi:MAG TPA: hypothetical protein VFA20_15135 [Myxococcaceae bacterium]|nr:hypothetical protein [Myxococcaceae bacterium]
MRRAALLFALLLSSTAFAQVGAGLFGGSKPPLFREQELDRRFKFSKVNRLLMSGEVEGMPCLQLTGALYVALGEIAPYLHKKDERFYLDPALGQSFAMQMDSQRFPGSVYLLAMVRRVLIDGRMPREWLVTAAQVNKTVGIIDMAKLKYLADGVQHIDSAYFSYEMLRQRLKDEVGAATTAAAGTAGMAFRDTYLDRQVTWGGLQVIDVGAERRAPIKGRKNGPALMVEQGGIVAHLQWTEPAPANPFMMTPDPDAKMPKGVMSLFGSQKRAKAVITARLLDQQYTDLYALPKGGRVMVKGRLFEMNNDVSQVVIKDALLFVDRDWSQGAILADPNVMLTCPAAVNDVTGAAPGAYQPGGFGQHSAGH